MTDERLAADGRVVSGDRRHRWRDWLIALGSLVWFIGVLSPLYLAWRDRRRRWLAVSAVLTAATIAAFALIGTTATENVGTWVEVVAWLGGIAAAVALAASGRANAMDSRRLRLRWKPVYELGAEVVVLAATVLFVLLALGLLGLGVRGLSKLVGMPLPYLHDNPGHLDWAGRAELVGYGIPGAVAVYLLYRLEERILPTGARRRIGRVLGVAGMLGLAVAAASVAVDERNVFAGGAALSFAYGAFRLARGLPLDPDDRAQRDSALPASFDTPVKIVDDEEPTGRVETWAAPPRRSLVIPTAPDLGSRRPSHTDPIEADDDART